MTNPTRISTFAIAVSALALSACAGFAVAEVDQPHMRNALSDLKEVRAELAQATTNKGGHRLAALAHVDQAIREVHLGMDRADGYITPAPR